MRSLHTLSRDALERKRRKPSQNQSPCAFSASVIFFPHSRVVGTFMADMTATSTSCLHKDFRADEAKLLTVSCNKVGP